MGAFRVRVLEEAAAPSPGRALAALPPACRPFLLDSSDGQGWSLLAWSPDRVLEHRIAARSAPRKTGERWPRAADPARLLDEACRAETWSSDAPGLPLAGGWLGYFGFECGHAYESYPWLPPDPAGLPDLAFARYRRAVLWDPGGRARLLWAEGAGDSRTDRATLQAEFRRMLAAPPLPEGSGRLSALPQPEQPARRFREIVERLREEIAHGELFQANLTHRLVGAAPADARAFYARLRRAQPTAMSAYWERLPNQSLLSWSPERFLQVRGERLETRPIKGTAPRFADPEEDRRAAWDLERSPKERAELNMIVDMARNDLGRLAPPGSVEVVDSGRVEAYPTVFHRVARVRSRWDPEAGLSSLFRATFPPASVTGAPKVRALQAIAEKESTGRGPYCGALGYWLPGEPRGDFSVLIRSATLSAGELAVRVGAGIVWDSEPAREWEETLWKARYLEAAAPLQEQHA